MRNVVLIGMPGCGKSTLGMLLAKAAMMEFIDTDLLLQKQSGKPLQQMVDELGTEGFSKVEEAAVCALEASGAVIATGGSVALESAAMAHLQKSSTVVFIRLSYETIEKRLGNLATRGVTIEPGQTLRDLYELRQPYYHRWADVTVEADGMRIEETVERLLHALHLPSESKKEVIL